MTLLVDIGNTRVKWCLMESGGALGAFHSLAHQGDLARLVEDPAWRAMDRPGRVVLCAVLSRERLAPLFGWIDARWGCAVRFAEAAPRAHGVINGYREARRLGADRWAALIGARHTCNGAACIFDCGTALTVDVLGSDGLHHGGLIVPGLRVMSDALGRHADALDAVTGALPEGGSLPVLATDTPGAISWGTLHATVAFIERMIREVRASLACEITPLLTGGDAGRVLPWLALPCQHRPGLVLQGLAVMAGEAP